MIGALDLFDPFAALAEIRGQDASACLKKLPQQLPQEAAEANHLSDHGVNLTSATSAGSAGCPDAHNLVRARVQTTACKNYIYNTYTYANDSPPDEAPFRLARGHPAEVAEAAGAAGASLSTSDQKETPLDTPAEVLRKSLRKFRQGLACLSTDRAPCPDYRSAEWPAVLARAHAFLDAFGEQALALGWTASSLFGVHPEAGTVRVDACGALVLPVGGPVRAITATSITFDHLTHRRKPGQPEGVPLWQFGRGA